jgi:hypothetical protein
LKNVGAADVARALRELVGFYMKATPFHRLTHAILLRHGLDRQVEPARNPLLGR